MDSVASLRESLRVLEDMRLRCQSHVDSEREHLAMIDESIAQVTCEIARRLSVSKRRVAGIVRGMDAWAH